MADANKVHRMYECLKEKMGAENFLEELYRSLDSDTLEVNFRWIMNMNDIEM